MITKLKLTETQKYLIDSYVFDLCNTSVHDDYTDAELLQYDESDQYRIKIYKKYSKGVLSGLTKDEWEFVSGEISHFMFDGFDRDRRDKISASAFIKKVDKILDKSFQRDSAIDSILS